MSENECTCAEGEKALQKEIDALASWPGFIVWGEQEVSA